ncbi:RNA-dependent RNA polymerase [Parastagonospora nodorum]|nr:RNA-dependent RNA polymerase [Parastagonospora nodorum]
MDIFITNVPPRVNRVELRMFLKDKLQAHDILAFDVFKKVGENWATVTVAHEKNGRSFIKRHGFRGPETLNFKSAPLGVKASNRKGQPEPLKVLSLQEKESTMKAKHIRQLPTARHDGSPSSIFPIHCLMTGVWGYDHLGKLIFDQKLKDTRAGSVIFGKYALMIYLKNATHTEDDWHCRIDIPYAILEHTLPSVDNGTRGSITLTLKAPPKIYKILDTEDLHLYTGQLAPQVEVSLGQLMRDLKLDTASRRPKPPKLERLCRLHRQSDKNTALCMVYKLQFPDRHSVRQAWTFLKSFSVPELHCWKTMVPHVPTKIIEGDFNDLVNRVSKEELAYAVQFQMFALVFEGTITPRKMTEMLPSIVSMADIYGPLVTASAVRLLQSKVPTPGPHVGSSDFQITTLRDLLAQGIKMSQDTEHYVASNKRGQQDHVVLTHKATITPTGIFLRGPDADTSNRILRKYSQYTDYFMRVSFTDEDGVSVFHDPKASQHEVYERFRKILREGIHVAGRHFEFLGFSHASLRCHQVWFMAPFIFKGLPICARDVIQNLGDFNGFTCSARCAARIGQAFSDTIFAVQIPSTATILETKEDITRNNRVFSDGCGTMSLELFQLLWRKLNPQQRRKRPTVLQIRCRGAKGVLSLDSSLVGEELHIRKSMTKFIAGSEWRDLEICSAAYRPLRVYLNHQFIKILEDLGVPPQNFIKVQNEARKQLELIVKHPLNAADFLRYSHSADHAKIPRLFELMHYAGLSFQTDQFLCEIVEVAAMSSIRDLKYRARIPVESGHLLYGIMDETNTLKEGEVYVATEDETPSGRREKNILIGDRVVVTRAPALHPGDVQLVSAVNVPDGSPLRSLHNCIVFSQQGARDLPSQLSGGDLDGDLFHVIWDPLLIPKYTVPAADYAAAAPFNLGRPVEVNDIVDFFIGFMQNDKLGQISNMHKIRADKRENGTFDSDCILLAKLASDAVDFSKSGVPAKTSDIPRDIDIIRPDFMAPGHNFVINDLGSTELQDLEIEDIEDPDSLSILDHDMSRVRYYRSKKALGHLYRAIDEREFFDHMKSDFAAMQSSTPGLSLMQKLEQYIDRETHLVQWAHHTTFAEELREYYEFNMIDIMDTMRVHRRSPLTELEVFSGNILGKKERASTRFIRQANEDVQERFNRDVSGIVSDIVRGDGEGDAEALPRAIACFKVALQTEGWENQVLIKSWKYVAASVCLEQLWKFQGGSLRPL